MTKQCVICGKEFEPRYNLVNRQKCCSRECSKKQHKIYSKNYSRTEKERQRQRDWRKEHTKNHTLCRICGKPTVAEYTRNKPHYHEECVVADCVETLRNGNKLSRAQYQRLYVKGYTMQEIYEIAKQNGTKII